MFAGRGAYLSRFRIGGLFCKRCCSGVQGCRLLGLGVKGSRVLLCGGGALGSCLISGTPERLQVLVTPTVGATYKIEDFVVGVWDDSCLRSMGFRLERGFYRIP